MFDGDNRRRAPVRLEAELLHSADHGQFVRPGAGGVDQDARLEGFLAGADFPARSKPLGGMDPGAGNDVHPGGFGAPAVVLQQHGRVAAEGPPVQAGRCEGFRLQRRAQFQRFRVGDPVHVPAGFPADRLLVADQHKAPGGKHRHGQLGVLAAINSSVRTVSSCTTAGP